MTDSRESADAKKLYTSAHTQQYTKKNLRAALKLYRNIIVHHSDTQEAAFSRAQVQQIVNSAVPKQELLDAQMALAEKHLGAP